MSLALERQAATLQAQQTTLALLLKEMQARNGADADAATAGPATAGPATAGTTGAANGGGAVSGSGDGGGIYNIRLGSLKREWGSPDSDFVQSLK